MESVVRSILEYPHQGVLAVTGGGVGGIYELLRYGGASSFILEAVVPYATAAFEKFVKTSPEKFCSREGARLLAVQAYARALELTGSRQTSEHPLFGVGLSCSLARHEGERPGREHHVYIATQTATRNLVHSIHLKPQSRSVQEEVVSKLLLLCIAEMLDLSKPLISALRTVTEEYIQKMEGYSSHFKSYAELLTGRLSCNLHAVDLSFGGGEYLGPLPMNQVRLLFPGSFNPLHAGHLEMARIASAKIGAPAVFELSISNVDKPLLDIVAVQERRNQFMKGGFNLAVTNAPSFTSKAAIFPGCTFIVGLDTWKRLNDVKYHAGSPERLAEARKIFKLLGVKFLVFGRKVGESFEVLQPGDDLAIPVPETEYRMDISSTELREGATRV